MLSVIVALIRVLPALPCIAHDIAIIVRTNDVIIIIAVISNIDDVIIVVLVILFDSCTAITATMIVTVTPVVTVTIVAFIIVVVAVFIITIVIIIGNIMINWINLIAVNLIKAYSLIKQKIRICKHNKA